MDTFIVFLSSERCQYDVIENSELTSILNNFLVQESFGPHMDNKGKETAASALFNMTCVCTASMFSLHGWALNGFVLDV